MEDGENVLAGDHEFNLLEMLLMKLTKYRMCCQFSTYVSLRGQRGPRPKIVCNAIVIECRQSYLMLFTGSKNIDPSRINRNFKLQNKYNYLATACFTRDYLKILSFYTKNLSLPTVFELET